MSLYKELSQDLSDYPKLYRFEGYKSFHYFDTSSFELKKNYFDNYIFFSKSEKHHIYYTERRIKQYILEQLDAIGVSKNFNMLLDDGIYREVKKRILINETRSLTSLSFINSSLLPKVLEGNYVLNKNKENGDQRVVRCDHKIYGGGYGFTTEWLTLFYYMTYAFTFQRITADNIIEYINYYNSKKVKFRSKNDTSLFLQDLSKKTIVFNESVFSDFSKYYILNTLQEIVEKKLYFDTSIFGDKPNDAIRELVAQFIEERNRFLETAERGFSRTLKRTP